MFTMFQAFFNYPGMAELLPYFCVFHINAPGQEEAAEKLPDDFVYPNMDEMAEQVRTKMKSNKLFFCLIKRVIFKMINSKT